MRGAVTQEPRARLLSCSRQPCRECVPVASLSSTSALLLLAPRQPNSRGSTAAGCGPAGIPRVPSLCRQQSFWRRRRRSDFLVWSRCCLGGCGCSFRLTRFPATLLPKELSLFGRQPEKEIKHEQSFSQPSEESLEAIAKELELELEQEKMHLLQAKKEKIQQLQEEMRQQEEEEAQKLHQQKEKSLRYFPFLLCLPVISPTSLSWLQFRCRWPQAGAVTGHHLKSGATLQSFGQRRQGQGFWGGGARGCLPGTGSPVRESVFPRPAGLDARAASRARNLPLTGNLGRVPSPARGALPPGRRSDPGLNGRNRTGNGSIRGDEVTPEELSEALVLCLLQRGFQTRP